MKKRIVSLLCAFTMIAGLGFGISAKDKKVLATTGDAPTVEMVGATILKGSTDAQSLRFLMKVKNYQNITNQDFGINLSIGNSKKVKKVSYRTEATEIYAINEDSLEYVVEVTGIGYDNIATNINAQAFIDGKEVVPADTIVRNVNSVAEEAGYILTQGEGNKIVTEKNKTAGYEMDLQSNVTVLGKGKVIQNAAEDVVSVVSDESGKPKGMVIPLGETLEKDSEYEITINGSATESFRIWFAPQATDGDPKSSQIYYPNFGAATSVKMTQDANYLIIKGIQYDTEFDKFTINKIMVKKVVSEGFTNATEPYVANLKQDISEDGVEDSSVSQDNVYSCKVPNFKGVSITAPNKKLYDKVKITYECSEKLAIYLFDSAFAGSTGQNAPGENETGVYLETGGEKTLTIERCSKKDTDELIDGICALKFVRLNWNFPSDKQDLKIKEVEFIPATTP